MKKLYEKSESWFAVMWIVLYVVGVSVTDGISKGIGVPYLITAFYAILMLTVLLLFMKKNDLTEKYGLCRFGGSYKEFLFFVPLIAICSINFWNGVTIDPSVGECVLSAAAKGIAGIVEELIFRGLLFVAMCKSDVKSAVIVSSLTFGVGHIVNLLNGAPVFDTVCQIIYACAIGFCFTAVFLVGKSVLPCALAHFIVNASSAFGAAPADMQIFHVAATIFLTVVSAGYGAWLLIRHKEALKTAV